MGSLLGDWMVAVQLSIKGYCSSKSSHHRLQKLTLLGTRNLNGSENCNIFLAILGTDGKSVLFLPSFTAKGGRDSNPGRRNAPRP